MAIVFPGGTQTAPAKIIGATSNNTTTQATFGTNSWGELPMTLTYTPSTTSSKLLVAYSFTVSSDHGNDLTFLCQRNGSSIFVGSGGNVNGIGNVGVGHSGTWVGEQVTLTFIDSPSSTSAQTYRFFGYLQSGQNSSNNWRVNVSRASGSDGYACQTTGYILELNS